MLPDLEHLSKIQQAIEYIRTHIEEPITAEQVAKAAHVSTYHFHRMFKRHMRETLGQYITRKKLEAAAISLLYGRHASITALAHQYGYASTASFSKAFVGWFGCRPSQIHLIHDTMRHQQGRLQQSYDKQLREAELLTPHITETAGNALDWDAINQRVSIRTIDAFSVYYMTSQGGYHLDALDQVWLALQERLEDLGIPWHTLDRFSICHDHPGLLPKECCRYDACVKIDDHVPPTLPLLQTTIPAGRYAIFPCHGPPEEVLPQYIAFYATWMTQSPYMPDHFPVIDHHLNCAHQTPDDNKIIECWAKIVRCP